MTSFASGWVFFAGLCAVLFLSACGNGDVLTDDEMDKLTPALQRVVQGEEAPPMADLVTSQHDGETVYAVLLRVSDADAVRDAGIPLNSVQGSIATARLTAEQLRSAARHSSVSRIEPSGTTRPTS